MTAPRHGPAPGSPAAPDLPPTGHDAPAGSLFRRRTGVLLAAAAVAVVLLVLAAVWAARSGDSGTPVDRTDPESVATAFVQRYAVGDPAVCELATPRLRTTLDRQGRCTGQPTGRTVPAVTTLVSQTCGTSTASGHRSSRPVRSGRRTWRWAWSGSTACGGPTTCSRSPTGA